LECEKINRILQEIAKIALNGGGYGKFVRRHDRDVLTGKFDE